MKLEIEITEAEIKDVIERKVHVAIADQTNQWQADNIIKERVKAMWSQTVTDMIQECLSNSTVLKEKIQSDIEAKLKGQITALMRGPK